MMKYNRIICVFAVMFVLCVCSCNLDNSRNDQYCYEQQKVESIAEKVIDGITKGDRDSLYSMFSEKNKENTDLYEQLDLMFGSVDWGNFNTSQIEQYINGGGESYREGKIVEFSAGYKISGIVDSEGNEFIVSFGCTTISESHPEDIGINQMSIRRVCYEENNMPTVLDSFVVGGVV